MNQLNIKNKIEKQSPQKKMNKKFGDWTPEKITKWERITGKRKTGCACKDVSIQSYKNQSVVYYPDWFESDKKVRAAAIDNCILIEVLSLWEKGIQTVESCCGHNQAQGYIAVLPKYHEAMIDLGYELWQSNFRNEEGWDEEGYQKGFFKCKS